MWAIIAPLPPPQKARRHGNPNLAGLRCFLLWRQHMERWKKVEWKETRVWSKGKTRRREREKEIKKLSTKNDKFRRTDWDKTGSTRGNEKQEEIRSGQHKEGTMHVRNKGSLAVDKSREVSAGACVGVWSERPAVPSGSLEQLIQSADTLPRNRSRYWAVLRDNCSSGHTHSDSRLRQKHFTCVLNDTTQTLAELIN